MDAEEFILNAEPGNGEDGFYDEVDVFEERLAAELKRRGVIARW